MMELPAEVASRACDPANIVGRYVRVSRLGAGGMGEVWKAWDRDLARWVALKLVKGDDPAEATRFLREAQTAASLTHPHIASVYEAGVADGRPFIAMQLVRGDTLANVPSRDRRRIARLLRDAAAAVQHAHAAGIVHRDLKPANIMVEDDRVYVLDFGLARRLAAPSSLSATGLLVGTPAYMPPEQARGDRADARSDVYALGATLYEALTGRPPFQHDNLYDLLVLVVAEDAVPPRRLNPSVEPDLQTIVLTCLDKDPARRYPTAQALADELDRWLDGEPIRARAPSTLYRLRKRIAKSKGLLAVGALGLVGILAVTGVFVPRWRAEARELARERERSAALQELGTLWMRIVLARQGFSHEHEDPARVRRDLADALRQVDAFVARHPGRPQALYVRARGRLYLDDFVGAERDLRAAIALDGRFAPAHALLGQTLLEKAHDAQYGPNAMTQRRRTRYRDLMRQAREEFALAEGAATIERWGLVRTREDEVGAVLMQVQMALIAEDGATARSMLIRADSEAPAPEYANLLAAVGPREERLRWYERALRLMPHNARALFCRAALLEETGDVEGAARDYAAALAVNPRLSSAWVNVGNARVGKGDVAGGIAAYEQGLEGDPDNTSLLYNRAYAHWLSGNTLLAIRDYGRVIELEPDFPGALVGRAGARAKRGEMVEAMADYDRAIELDVSAATALANRAMLRHRIGDAAAALADAEDALRRDSSEALAWFVRGLVRAERRDTDGAYADYSRALELHPRLADAWNNRGLCRHDRGDFAGAIEDYTRSIALEPSAAPYNNRGFAHEALGDDRAALADYSRGLELDGTLAVLWTRRGLAHRRLGDLPRAMADLNRAIELDVRSVTAHAGRALARSLAGDREGAVKDYSAALELDPRHVESLVNRGMVRDALGDRAGAVADLRAALDVAPPGWPHRAKVEEALRRIERK